MLNIVICGGGNLATVCAGFVSAQESVKVSILTRHPEAWSQTPVVMAAEGQQFHGRLNLVTRAPQEVVPQADIVLLCLPAFAIENVLRQIKPFLHPTTVVGSIVANTGFFFAAHNLLQDSQPLFGFQRVPFIARTTTYGHEAQLMGYKSQLHVAIEHSEDAESLREQLEQLFNTPTHLLHNFYEASLSNSNPILHTGRLFTLWKDWNGETLPQPFRFYDEWTLESSEMILKMDAEFMCLTHHLGITEDSIPSLLTYYESTDAHSLTRKLQSIEAFHGILAPMKETPSGWIPDFSSRYFTEDFPYGLRFIRDLLVQEEIDAPFIEEVYQWGMMKVGNKKS